MEWVTTQHKSSKHQTRKLLTSRNRSGQDLCAPLTSWANGRRRCFDHWGSDLVWKLGSEYWILG